MRLEHNEKRMNDALKECSDSIDKSFNKIDKTLDRLDTVGNKSFKIMNWSVRALFFTTVLAYLILIGFILFKH